MSLQSHLTAPASTSESAATNARTAVAQKAGVLPQVTRRVRQWLEAAGRAHQRTEQQILERFRVPPNGA